MIFGCENVCVRMLVTVAWDCCAVIFFVKFAILSKLVKSKSQNGSKPAPRPMASSE